MLVGYDRAVTQSFFTSSPVTPTPRRPARRCAPLESHSPTRKLAGVGGVRHPGSRQEVGIVVPVEHQLGAAIRLGGRSIVRHGRLGFWTANMLQTNNPLAG